MEKYNCNDDTLFHGILFNIPRLISIMENGIVSSKYANENNISLSKNYNGANLDDTISLVRYLYVNYNNEDSSYNSYIAKGISFIVEDIPFIYDIEKRVINRPDEVLVEGYIPKEKVKGIMIPKEYENKSLKEVKIIDSKMKNYNNVKNTSMSIITYLKANNYEVDTEYYSQLIHELRLIHEAADKLNEMNVPISDEDYKDLLNDSLEVIEEINDLLAISLDEYFCHLFQKEEVTILEIVTYLNNKYLNVPIYNVPSDNLGRKL